MTSDPRQLAALIHAQETIASAGLEVGDVLTVLAAHARELTGAAGAVVELVDPDGTITQGAADNASVLVGVRMPDASASARAIMQRRLVRWDEPSADVSPPTPAAGEGRNGAKGVVAAPLGVEGEDPMGV